MAALPKHASDERALPAAVGIQYLRSQARLKRIQVLLDQ